MAVGGCEEKAGGPPANRTEKRGRKRDGPPVLKSCMFRLERIKPWPLKLLHLERVEERSKHTLNASKRSQNLQDSAFTTPNNPLHKHSYSK